MPVEYLTPRIADCAVEMQTLLADRGLHRALSIPDLLIAASAGLSELTLLHVDEDYELIADITGQPVAPRRRLTAIFTGPGRPDSWPSGTLVA
jgi:predicted nucleic acid-binding protein